VKDPDITFKIANDDRSWWVLEKLALAIHVVETSSEPIEAKIKPALDELVAVVQSDLPMDLRERLAPIRSAAQKVAAGKPLSPEEASEVALDIFSLRRELDTRLRRADRGGDCEEEP
jgi:hypothetical protein